MVVPRATVWPSSTGTRVTRPPANGVTLTLRYAFGSTVPGSRRPAATMVAVDGLDGMPDRCISSGAS